MGTRYVWERFNRAYAYTSAVIDDTYCLLSGTSGTVYVYHFNSMPTYDPEKGTWSLSNYTDLNAMADDDSIAVSAGTYFALARNSSATATTTLYRSGENTSVKFYDALDVAGVYFVSGTSHTVYSGQASYSKGAISYGNVANSASGKYPNNGYSGNYWYVKLGSDNVDPASISIADSVKGSDGTITAVATPVSNTYGGTISYRYEYSTDGGTTWTAAATATATQQEIAIPAGAPTIKVRVRASDDMGFVSTDYVYSNVASVIWNNPPTAPGSITVPDQIVAGRSFTLSCGASSDEDGNLSGYSWERQYDGGAWVEFSTGAEPSVSTSVPVGTTSVAYRVRAYDTDAAYSDYCTGETRTVINNTAPVISGADSDLGTFGLTPPGAIDYTVTDVDGGAVNCTVTLDGAVVQEGAVELGAANSYAITASQWLSMLNGAHTVTITADDEYGATAVRTYTFTKDVAELSITLAEPWITDGRVARMYILPVWSVPDGATVQVLATNNALDAEPVWQDVTDAVKLGKKFYFANEVKTAGQWAVNFKVLADRGTADRVYIKKLTGAFDGIGGT